MQHNMACVKVVDPQQDGLISSVPLTVPSSLSAPVILPLGATEGRLLKTLFQECTSEMKQPWNQTRHVGLLCIVHFVS